jgi:cardiolipin synthase A/B
MFAAEKKAASGYSALNKVRLIRGGTEYFQLLLALIQKAEKHIHLQTYIYDDDETGMQVTEALKTAARRGIEVHLLADGYASKVLAQKQINALRKSGVQFRFFEPLIKSRYFYFGRRLHHKVFVADGRYALVGGINVSNRYNDMPGEPAWLDFALYTEGETATELCVLCWKTWNGFPKRMGLTPCELQPPVFQFNNNDLSRVRMRRNDWVRKKREISASYISAIAKAQTSITICCSYFLPGHIIRKALARASARGVKITVITAGRSDIMLTKHAERFLYNWLLKHQITLYEYQPAILHAKIAVCDEQWLTVGSYNINNISAYASIELNLDVQDAALARQTENLLQQIITKDCLPITPEGFTRTNSVFKRFIRWGAYHIIRVVFYMLTFYYKQRA